MNPLLVVLIPVVLFALLFLSRRRHAALNCQSCGMPLSKDDEGGGTNADGSRSDRFCSRCYRDGAFTQPYLTVEQMVAQVDDKLANYGISPMFRSVLTREIPRLERWRR